MPNTKTNSRIQVLGQAAKGRAARIRKIKVPGSGLAVGVLILAAITGAYLLWRAPDGQAPGNADVRVFHISTGSAAGTYFPVGEMIAAVVSEPPGSEPCDDQDRCGVRGLLAEVRTSQGSAANVRSLMSGRSDAALVQADIANWAHQGLAMFENEPAEPLRAIAALYPEAVQLVAAKSAHIKSISDLRGRRISIDRAGSGTQADALLILDAHGLTRADLLESELKPSDAADQLIAGSLDAFFLIAGTPATVITDLADRGLIDLVPIAGPQVARLAERSPFFVPDTIEAGIYNDVAAVSTISVKALLVTTEKIDAELVQDLTAALWRPGNRAHLDSGHAKGRLIRLETALDGISIPLHAGAEAYYRGIGKL